MLYKCGDRVLIYNLMGEETEATIISPSIDGTGYIVVPLFNGNSWVMQENLLPDYPDAMLGERCWFYFSERIIGLAYETVVIDTVG